MKALLTLLTLAVVTAAAPARAEKLELSTVKCKDLISRPKAQIEVVVMWLQGYYTLENAPRIVDYDKMQADSVKLGDYCRKNPNESVVDAADEVMGE
jgi:acid stress chaperone HdeB